MKEFSIKTLAKIINAQLEHDTSYTPRVTPHASCTGVSIDTRTIRAGDCFFAVIGENFDGHDYITEAFAKGAVCAVVAKKAWSGKLTGKPILKVEDTVKAIGDFARQYRRQSSFKTVAITGSVGKTTTRQIAYHLLSRHYRVFAAPKNFNNKLGLPLTLLAADPDDEIIIAELGSSYTGEIAYLTRIVQPHIAVVTNVYPAHLAGFANLQAIINEKLSISDALQDDGVLLINGDFDTLVSASRVYFESRATSHEPRIMTFGESDNCDIQAHNITYNSFGSEFTIDGTKIVLPLPGRGNVENALAAWSICSRFGLTINDFADAVKTVPVVPMRAEPLKIGTLTVLNDCYNANPASMNNALDILTNLALAQNERLVFICGDMAELAQQAESLHAELGACVAKTKVRLLLTVGKLAKITAETAKRNAKYDLQTKSFENTFSLCDNLQEFIEDYDIVLVKGSRAVKLEMAVEKLKELFS